MDRVHSEFAAGSRPNAIALANGAGDPTVFRHPREIAANPIPVVRQIAGIGRHAVDLRNRRNMGREGRIKFGKRRTHLQGRPFMFFERPFDSKPVLVNRRKPHLVLAKCFHVRFPGKAGAQGVALCHRRLERLAMMCSFCPFSRRSEGEIVGETLPAS